MNDACQIKQACPKDFYKIKDKIGRGGFATIFKCVRLADNHECVLKYTGLS